MPGSPAAKSLRSISSARRAPGKTTLLERTIRDLQRRARPLRRRRRSGDDRNDGDRIRAAGAPCVQVNTGTGCHLEADMIARGLAELKPAFGSVVLIENVGNLVCPALFDLGERAKVVILSVTEGEDKPLKYPHMFRAARGHTAEQDRSAAPPRFRRRKGDRQRQDGQSGRDRLSRLGPFGRGSRGLVRLDPKRGRRHEGKRRLSFCAGRSRGKQSRRQHRDSSRLTGAKAIHFSMVRLTQGPATKLRVRAAPATGVAVLWSSHRKAPW